MPKTAKEKKYVQNALKHVKNPARMLTTHSHLSEGDKKYPDEFPISFRIRFTTIKANKSFLKKCWTKIDYFARRGWRVAWKKTCHVCWLGLIYLLKSDATNLKFDKFSDFFVNDKFCWNSAEAEVSQPLCFFIKTYISVNWLFHWKVPIDFTYRPIHDHTEN